MRRVCLLLAVTLLATLTLAGSAHAAKRLSAAQVAKALTTKHAFVQPGSKPPPDRAALNAVAAANPSFYLVVLSRKLIGAPTPKAAARLLTLALQPTNPQATVGVIQGGKLGGASLSYPQERIDKAVADSGAVAATDPTGALTSYAQAVSKPNKNPDDGGAGSASSGRPTWQWIILILLVVGIAERIFALFLWLTKPLRLCLEPIGHRIKASLPTPARSSRRPSCCPLCSASSTTSSPRASICSTTAAAPSPRSRTRRCRCSARLLFGMSA